MANGLREAEKLEAKARKLTSPALLSFRWQSDWETATPLFEKAAGLFKAAKAFDRAQIAYEKASTGQERLGSSWHAAKLLENAAGVATSSGDMSSQRDLYSRAAQLYVECGRPTTAAETLLKCARAIETTDAQGASGLYLQAIEIMEGEGKAAMAGDTFRTAIGSMLKMQRYADAVNLLLRFAVVCDTTGATGSQCKCYLSAVVVWLFAGDASQAWAVYQDALGVDAFSRSDHAFGAEELFNAYRSGTAAEIKACVAAKPVFLDLDNQVARLAKQLPQGDLQRQAAALGGSSGTAKPAVSAQDLDEDDLM